MGVGKTRLAREAIASGQRQGAVARSATATASAATVPLGALSPLFPRTARENRPIDAPTLARAVEALADPGSAGPKGPRAPTVLLAVDDAHLLDDASAALIHQLALAGAASLLITVRSGAPAPGTRSSPSGRTSLDRVEIGPLPPVAAAELVARMVGGPVDEASLRRVGELTDGNPRYLREVVEAACEGGQLTERAGVWRWEGEFSPGDSLTELVMGGLADLATDERSLVDALAFGEPLSAPAAALLSSWHTLATLEHKGVVTVAHDGRRCHVRLAHPPDGAVVRARTSTLRARWARRTLLAAEATHPGRRRGDAWRRATLQLDSGETADGGLLVRAATEANLSDPTAGARLAAAALAAGEGSDAIRELGVALAYQQRLDEAEAELRRATVTAATDEQHAGAALKRASVLFWGRDAPAAAAEVLGRAEHDLTTTDFHYRLVALRSTFAVFSGRTEEALDAVLPLLATGDDQVVARASAAASAALGRRGRTAEAVAASDRGWAALERAGELEAFGAALAHSRVSAALLAGRVGDAEARVDEFRRQCVARRVPGKLAIASLLDGQVALAAGRPVTARRRLHEAAVVLPEGTLGAWRYWALLGLAEACAVSGEPGPAAAALAQARTARRRVFRLWEPDALLAQAWVAAMVGELTRARALTAKAASAASAMGQSTMEVVALHASVRLGAADRAVAARLTTLAERVDSRVAEAAARHAAGLIDGDGDALDDASRSFDGMGNRLVAAEAANQAALAHRAGGRRASALASAGRARQLAAACDGARTPALAQGVEEVRLTRREREVAGLAARGLSSRTIADHLVVSVRTVEGHLERTYAKLGLHSRADLATALNTET